MSAPPPNSNVPSGDDSESFDGDEEQRAASDPEEARKAAEEALAEIEAMADLEGDVESEAGSDREQEAEPSVGGAAADTDDPDSSGEGTPEDQCENCGALLHGPYCSQCGQRAADRIVPIWHMINEALEAAFELDMRVIHTLPKLFFLPGRLTKEYLNGRRKRYIRPFRLYLFSTFLLFATLALTTGGGIGLTFDPEASAVRLDSTETAVATSDTSGTGGTGTATWFGGPEQREEVARNIEEEFDEDSVTVNIGDSATNARVERLLRTNAPRAVRNPRDFVGTMIDYGPYVMFFMLPVFAFFLKLLYLRRRRLYVEHLIFSLHVHALAFFAFTFGILLGETGVGWVETVGSWIEVAPFLYLFLGMWHVYEQGLFKTAVKYLILLSAYSFLLLLGFLLLLFVAMILM